MRSRALLVTVIKSHLLLRETNLWYLFLQKKYVCRGVWNLSHLKFILRGIQKAKKKQILSKLCLILATGLVLVHNKYVQIHWPPIALIKCFTSFSNNLYTISQRYRKKQTVNSLRESFSQLKRYKVGNCLNSLNFSCLLLVKFCSFIDSSPTKLL